VTDPLAAAPAKAAPARDYKPRIEPKFEPKIETRVEPPVEQKAAPKLEPARGKAAFDNLEEEMASLLGRPPGKT
jgi:flagellar protein FliO/FliZ